MYIPITSTIVVIAVCIAIVLSLRVSLRRKALGEREGEITKYAHGHGGDGELNRRIRAFGNFVEYTPLFLIVLLLAELQEFNTTFLWLAGIIFMAGRILHASDMRLRGGPMKRIIAMMMTFTALALPAVWLLYNVWQ